VLIVTLLALCLAACGSKGDDEPAKYSVTIAEGIQNGTVTVDKAKAAKDATITITVTPAEGYELDTLSAKDADGNALEITDNTFKMPEKAVEVSASFKQKETVQPDDENKEDEDKDEEKKDDENKDEEKKDDENKDEETEEDATKSDTTIAVSIAPNSTVTVTKTVSADNTTITLTAADGFTGYKWLIDGTAAATTAVSADGKTLTLTASNLIPNTVYKVSVSATKDGMPHGAQISVKK